MIFCVGLKEFIYYYMNYITYKTLYNFMWLNLFHKFSKPVNFIFII